MFNSLKAKQKLEFQPHGMVFYFVSIKKLYNILQINSTQLPLFYHFVFFLKRTICIGAKYAFQLYAHL